MPLLAIVTRSFLLAQLFTSFALRCLEWHDVIESDLTLHYQPKSVAAVNEVGF
jgi:hypothetical protein